jgi:hypothetical protein
VAGCHQDHPDLRRQHTLQGIFGIAKRRRQNNTIHAARDQPFKRLTFGLDILYSDARNLISPYPLTTRDNQDIPRVSLTQTIEGWRTSRNIMTPVFLAGICGPFAWRWQR